MHCSVLLQPWYAMRGSALPSVELDPLFPGGQDSSVPQQLAGAKAARGALPAASDQPALAAGPGQLPAEDKRSSSSESDESSSSSTDSDSSRDRKRKKRRRKESSKKRDKKKKSQRSERKKRSKEQGKPMLSIADLRAQRLAREQAERQRERQVLLGALGKDERQQQDGGFFNSAFGFARDLKRHRP